MLFDEYVFQTNKHDKFPAEQIKKSFVEHFSLTNDYDFRKIFEFIESFNEYETIIPNAHVISIFGESSDWNNGEDLKCQVIRKMLGVRPKRLSSMGSILKNEYFQIDGYYDIRKGIVVLFLTSLLDSQLQHEYENQSSPTNVEVDELLIDNAKAQIGLYKALLVLFHLSHIVIVHYTSLRFQSSTQRLFKILTNFSKQLRPFIDDLFARYDYRASIPSLLFVFDCRFQQLINSKNQRSSILSMQKCIVSSIDGPIFNLSKDKPFVYFILPRHFYSSSQHFLMESDLAVKKSDSLSTFLQTHLKCSSKVSSKKFFLVFEKFLLLIKNNDSNVNIEKIFDKLEDILDVNGRFSKKVCEKTLVSTFKFYQEKLPQFYNKEMHEERKNEAVRLFQEISKGNSIEKFSELLVQQCNEHWTNGRQSCEAISLTGNNCALRLHALPCSPSTLVPSNDANLLVCEHSNSIKHISACNCGRRQGKRFDPFSLKAANFDFYQKMKSNCRTCRVINSIDFPENILSTKMNKKNFQKNDRKNKDKEKDKEEDEKIIDNEMNVENDNDGSDEDEESASFEMDDCEFSSNSDEFDDDYDDDDEDEEYEDEDGDEDEDENEDEESEKNGLDNDENINDEEVKNIVDIVEEAVQIDPAIMSIPMFHVKCPSGIYPPFPSWSLVKLGHSSLYSHDKGLKDQQGFVKGSNYLMPWNVRVMMPHKRGEKLWSGKPPAGVKQKKKTKFGTQFTVKVFLGTEYECLKGHRFICSGPNEILRRQTEKKIKDEKIQADQIATKHMPIYIHCMCHKENSPSVAQLMRVHVVTPKVPINVTLNPFVKFNNQPDSTVFFPGQKEPIKLEQASYWVLRLPLFYEDRNGLIRFPNNGDLPGEFCLASGCYGISNEFDVT